MLIRLVGHFIDNPNRIDKLICIKGLPDEWFFRPARGGGRELIKPWEPDVEANIPKECRDLCEPFEVTEVFSPIQPGRDFTIDKRMVSAVRFDYVTEAGQTAWDRIERYLERTVPRDQMVPKPVLVAPDHKSAFSPHEGRRSVRGSMELRPVEGIPVIDLRPVTAPIVPAAPAVVVVAAENVAPKPEPKITAPAPAPTKFACTQCAKSFDKQLSLRMHVMHGHKKKETAGV